MPTDWLPHENGPFEVTPVVDDRPLLEQLACQSTTQVQGVRCLVTMMTSRRMGVCPLTRSHDDFLSRMKKEDLSYEVDALNYEG